MLRKIIYSGRIYDEAQYFLINGFPELIEEIKEFEKSCCSLKFIVHPTTESVDWQCQSEDLSQLYLESYLQKQFRLMKVQNLSNVKYEIISNPNTFNFVVIVGQPQTGKTTAAKVLTSIGYKLLDAKVVETELKAKLSTDDNQVETVNET